LLGPWSHGIQTETQAQRALGVDVGYGLDGGERGQSGLGRICAVGSFKRGDARDIGVEKFSFYLGLGKGVFE
jgi:hypothetical protein